MPAVDQPTKDTHLSAARRHRSALRLTEGGVEQAFQREHGGGDLGAREAHVPIDAAGHSVECGVSCNRNALAFRTAEGRCFLAPPRRGTEAHRRVGLAKPTDPLRRVACHGAARQKRACSDEKCLPPRLDVLLLD